MGSQWYKDAIIYELHVRCFFDSDGDGIGDFQGLQAKLDYLQDLGVTAIWLLPFYPSPLKDDGYDIADYCDIHPLYGTLRDFKTFLREAHRRGLKVITELVINHTSDQHPWFQEARKGKKRDFYVWNDTPDRYKEARIIFQDFEASNWTWDAEAKSYYWHRFYSHQPDLNFDNPEVQKEIFRVLSFWMKMGVDGVRLDAIPYLYEREGTTCENLPETHAFLKKLRAYVDAHFEDRMLLAEANQWPEEAAEYFGEGDECHMAFHFPIMPRLFMAIHLEDSLPLIEITEQTPQIPESSQWALFLRNHDELTLEMVTDEERDYMFRVYAHDPQARINLGIRRRLAPLLKNDRRKIELMNSLLFSLTGTPVLYYGDEIGMGDNIYLGDRNGVRTPMQWSNDRNAGFSKTNPQRLYLPPIIDPEYHFETVNVEAQSNNPYSLLWWTKQLIALRKRFTAFGHGMTTFLTPENRKVLVFLRAYEDQLLLIIANLSRFPQYVELDLSEYNGYHVVELFSGESFPKIGELPYFLTLGPYGYYWFALEKEPLESVEARVRREREQQVATIPALPEGDLFHAKHRHTLQSVVGAYLLKRTWFLHTSQTIDRTKTRIVDLFSLPFAHLVVVSITLTNGCVERYPLVLSIQKGEEAKRHLAMRPEQVVVRFENQEETIVFDLGENEEMSAFCKVLIEGKKHLRGEKGEVVGIVPSGDHPLLGEEGHLVIFKQAGEGIDPDVEIRLFLLEHTPFRNFLPLAGYVEHRGRGEAPCVVAKEVITYPHKFNAKEFAIESAEHFLERAEAEKDLLGNLTLHPSGSWLTLAHGRLDKRVHKLLETPLEVARQLGEMTADFHFAMSGCEEEAFAPLPFTLFYQRSLYQTLRRKVLEGFSGLRLREPHLGLEIQKEVGHLLQAQERLLDLLGALPHIRLSARRLRHHGNFRLENLFYTGKHFLIGTFEGDPQQTYSEQRYKRSPLVDVASMLYSFGEAAFEGVERQRGRGLMTDQELYTLFDWARGWFLWMGASFLRAYFRKLKGVPFLPQNEKESDFLLGIFLIEQCLDHLRDSNRIALPVLLLKHWLPIYEKYRF